MAKHVKHDPPDLDDALEGWKQAHDITKVAGLSAYMKRCHTMLAHISKTRTEIARSGLKSWSNDWSIVEPHLDQLISDFLDGLSIHHKQICRHWVTTWLTGPYPCNDSLRDLVAILQ